MTQTVSQKEINDILWHACDTFRGTLDPTQYKDYILVMLFIKYMSDLWNDRRDQYVKQYKGDEQRVKRALDRERFAMPTVELRDKSGKVEVKVLERGFEYNGRIYKSLTAISKEVTGSNWNAFQFFKL